MPGGIFISYRRDDTAGFAGRLYDRLAGRFGHDRVFMDIDAIAPGHEFATDIDKALTDCEACVVLIGKQWLTIADANGHRRLDDPTDFVRLEIATAIRRGITVFPVLVDRASTPPSALLPEDIRPLAGRQAIELTSERWNYDSGRLLLALERELGLTVPPPKPPQSPEEEGRRRERRRRWRRRAAWIGGGAVVVLIAVAGWFATRSSDTDVGGGGGGGSPPLIGTYRVSMELTEFDGQLGENNQLWNEPDPTVGVSGDDWASQTWIFTRQGSWTVVERGVVHGEIADDGSYTDLGTAHCSTTPDGAEVTRRFVPTNTEPTGSRADSFTGTMTIDWDCEATGPIAATFSVAGTRTG